MVIIYAVIICGYTAVYIYTRMCMGMMRIINISIVTDREEEKGKTNTRGYTMVRYGYMLCTQ